LLLRDAHQGPSNGKIHELLEGRNFQVVGRGHVRVRIDALPKRFRVEDNQGQVLVGSRNFEVSWIARNEFLFRSAYQFNGGGSDNRSSDQCQVSNFESVPCLSDFTLKDMEVFEEAEYLERQFGLWVRNDFVEFVDRWLDLWLGAIR
jgi:hypothetical protein